MNGSNGSLPPAFRDWSANVLEPARRRLPERRAAFVTASGLPVPVLSVPESLEPSYQERLGFPGEFPFTRGIRPTMYRSRLWTMRQYSGFATAAESNRRYRALLASGQDGLSVAFDLPTQLGLDSDHPLSRGEVGKVGVAIDSLADMELLFQDIPLDRVSTSMTINAPAAVLLAMYAVVGEQQGVGFRQLKGTVQNDILKEYTARGTYIFPPRPSLALAGELIAWCAAEMPGFNPISISGYHIREAGATAAQEVAFTFANAIAYVETALQRGLAIDAFAPRLSFFFNAASDFFEEIAKFRAARRIWARLVREKFRATKLESAMLRFHVQTAGHTLTAQQVDNNLGRVTLQAMAAILGGAQSLHVNAKDEALSLPTDASAETALRIQQILAFETGIADSVDPLGGSYHVEMLTDTLERAILDCMAEVERAGGALAATESGFIQRQIEESAYRQQRAIDHGERIIVGVNRFRTEVPETAPPATDPSDGRLGVDAQLERLADVRARRDSAVVGTVLGQLEGAARAGKPVMPEIVSAVRAYATVGEICAVLRSVWGEHRP